MEPKLKARIIRKLRELSYQTEAHSNCLKASKVNVLVGKYKNGKDKYLVHHRCAKCDKLFRPDDVDVDHIDPVTPTNQSFSWHTLITRLFEGNTQTLCKRCHKIKTKREGLR